MTTAPNPMQALFNRAVTGVVKQGKLAYQPLLGCRLRTEDGLACAVGHCIDDQFYDPELEDHANPNVFSATRTAIIASNPDLDIDPDRFSRVWLVLERLQTAHDNSSDVNEFYIGANRIADQFGLEMPNILPTQGNEL